MIQPPIPVGVGFAFLLLSALPLGLLRRALFLGFPALLQGGGTFGQLLAVDTPRCRAQAVGQALRSGGLSTPIKF